MSKVNWTAPMKTRPGVVGQPPSQVFWWTISVYSKFGGGAVTYNEGPSGMTLAQGLNRVRVLGQIYGAEYVVCGTYLGGYGGRSTYCTLDGGVSTQYGQPPPFSPLPAVFPQFAPQYSVPRVRYTPFFGPLTVSPLFSGGGIRTFRTRVSWVGPIAGRGDGKVGFGYDEGTPVWQPGLSEEEKKSYFPWMQYSDATKNLQLAINETLKKNGCSQIGTDGKLGPNTCSAAKRAVELGGPAEIVGPPNTCQSYGVVPVCGVTQPTPPPPPECSNDKPCPTGFTCVQGKCAIIPTTPAPPSASTSSSGSGGLALLAAGAAAAIFFAFMKPPKLPKTAAGRLQENRRRKRRRRRAA